MTVRAPARCGALALIALAFSCRAAQRGDVVTLRIDRAAQPISAAAIRYEPAAEVTSAALSPRGWLAIVRRPGAHAVTVHVPGFCPTAVPAGEQTGALRLQPVIDLGGDLPPLGFDAAFAITARHNCPEHGLGRIRWRQLEGATLQALSASADGFQLTARTPRLELAHPEPFPPGIVPFSPRTQGRVVLEASWQGPGLPPVTRTVTIRATSRATGLSSVAVSQQLLLAGASFHVQTAPAGGHAQVQPFGALSQLTPDAPGRWVLARDTGEPLVVQAFWHDKTPYDCGRAECHAAIAAATLASPMSGALQSQLNGPEPASVGCMLDCHVLGERGSDDGGFLDVASELGFTWLDSTRWQDLPRALRRLGGVRCTACHGPGAIPPPGARADVLRSDVCATCHDAPPKYVHVQQWRASRMARSDETAATREAGCASCHTTGGFLAGIGARSPSAASQPSTPAGIACAACHAPHAPHSGARLIRAVPASEPDLEPRTALCLRCHSPLEDEPRPSASSGALWLGRARVPARDGAGWEPISSPSAHRAVPAGCTSCHGSPAAGGKLDHSFQADARGCTSCHASDGRARFTRVQDEQRDLQERAQALAARLAAACPSPSPQPQHALRAIAPCPAQPLTRARYELALVLEDRAAAFHNAAFARSLLDDVELALSSSAR